MMFFEVPKYNKNSVFETFSVFDTLCYPTLLSYFIKKHLFLFKVINLVDSDDEENLIKPNKQKKNKDEHFVSLEKTHEKEQDNSIVKDQITNDKNSQQSLPIPNVSDQNNENSNNMTKVTLKNGNNFHAKFWGLNEKDIDQEKALKFKLKEKDNTFAYDPLFIIKSKYARLGSLVDNQSSNLEFDTNEGIKVAFNGKF